MCKNLQPHGHEDTIGRAGARYFSDEGNSYLLSSLRNDSASVATLVLSDILAKRILEVREKREGTKLPKRIRKYSQLLCEIFDAYFTDEYYDWTVKTEHTSRTSVRLMIREGQLLISNAAISPTTRIN